MRTSRRPEPPSEQVTLDRLNSASRATAEAGLLECCASRRWAALLSAHRPYPDLDALLAAADEAAWDLTAEDVTEALTGEAAHHRIDELYRPGLAGLGHADRPGALAAHTALRAASAAYESRFGYAFLLFLDEHAPSERVDVALTSLHRRLTNEPFEERAVTAEELRRIARSRLRHRCAEGTLLDPAAKRRNAARSARPAHSGRI